MKILVSSCDSYEVCWKPFFTLLDKYYPEHPEVYLVCETKKCEYCKTINVNSDCWSVRVRKALEEIDDEQVLFMLDDFFIRNKVDSDRINLAVSILENDDNVAVVNFEKDYRMSVRLNDNWNQQFDNQVYLCSTQPSVWNKKALLSFLQDDINPWEFETRKISSSYKFLINNKDFIIDIGYGHQPLSVGWGITRGKVAKELLHFLASEDIDIKPLIARFDIL